MPCGYDAPRARARGARATPRELAALGARAVVAVDASAYFSRPGPRLIDGLELLAHILHPDSACPQPAGGRARPLELRSAGSSSRSGPGPSSPGSTGGSTSLECAVASEPANGGRGEHRAARPGRAPASGAVAELRIASAASAPPISPPMCPPQEMPGMREADDQVDQDQPAHAALHQRDLARAHLDGRGAHQPEDRAGGADGECRAGRRAARRASRRAATRRRSAPKRRRPSAGSSIIPR